MIYSYYNIIETTRASRKRLTVISDFRKLREVNKERKLTMILLCVVMCFFICVTPMAIVTVVQGLLEIELSEIQNFLSLSILYLNSVINFWIYSALNSQFRREALSFLHSMFKKNRIIPRNANLNKVANERQQGEK